MGFRNSLNRRHDLEALFALLSLEIWGRLFFLHQRLEEVADKVTRPSGQTAAGSILNIKEQPACDGAMISLQPDVAERYGAVRAGLTNSVI